MATQKPLLCESWLAAADLSANQYHAVKPNGSGAVSLCSTAGEKCLGLLQNEPSSTSHVATVGFQGISKAVAGGTITEFAELTVDASGHIVATTDPDDWVCGIALEAASSGQIFKMFLTHAGASNTVDGGLRYVTTTVSAAELAALNTAKVIVAAQGSGHVIEFVSAVVMLDYSADAITGQGDFAFELGTTNVSATIASATLLELTADAYVFVEALSAGAVLTANSALNLITQTGNPTTGGTITSTLKVKTVYRVHDFS